MQCFACGKAVSLLDLKPIGIEKRLICPACEAEVLVKAKVHIDPKPKPKTPQSSICLPVPSTSGVTSD